MADFARILACVDTVLGTEGFARYLGKQGSLAAESLTDDEFISADRGRSRRRRHVHGTASQLLKLATPTDEKWRVPKEWPKTSRAVTMRLHRQAPVMRKAGWTSTTTADRTNTNAVHWTITRPETGRNPGSLTRSPTSPASQASQASNEYGASPDSGPELQRDARASAVDATHRLARRSSWRVRSVLKVADIPQEGRVTSTNALRATLPSHEQGLGGMPQVTPESPTLTR